MLDLIAIYPEFCTRPQLSRLLEVDSKDYACADEQTLHVYPPVLGTHIERSNFPSAKQFPLHSSTVGQLPFSLQILSTGFTGVGRTGASNGTVFIGVVRTVVVTVVGFAEERDDVDVTVVVW